MIQRSGRLVSLASGVSQSCCGRATTAVKAQLGLNVSSPATNSTRHLRTSGFRLDNDKKDEDSTAKKKEPDLNNLGLDFMGGSGSGDIFNWDGGLSGSDSVAEKKVEKEPPPSPRKPTTNYAKQQAQLKHWISLRDSLVQNARKDYEAGITKRLSYKVLAYKHKNEKLVPDPKNPRENLIEDWNDINETIMNVGSPEYADQLSGAMYMHGVTEEMMCTKVNKFRDYCKYLTGDELLQVLKCTTNWNPSTLIGSDVMRDAFRRVDSHACSNVSKFDLTLRQQLAFLFSQLSFMPYTNFPVEMIKVWISNLGLKTISKEDLVTFMLLVMACNNKFDSDLCHVSVNVADAIEHKITTKFFDEMTPIELAVCYRGLKDSSKLSNPRHKIKDMIESVHGMRL